MTRRAGTRAMFGAGLVLVATGIVWGRVDPQTIDRSYEPRVAHPSYTGRWRPVVLIDAAHYNVHTASGTYRPFVELLRRDGYLAHGTTSPFSAAALGGARVLVVANALGLRGVLQHALNGAGLERAVRLRPSAISAEEIAEVERWVRGGGALLLAADHAPAGEAARGLAGAFGVTMTNWWAEDEAHHDTHTRNPGFIVFSRDRGLATGHPIAAGRYEWEKVGRVMTFTGQALRAPEGAVSLLTLSAAAREYPYRRSRESEGRPAAGLSQALALQHGRGRVVVLGEAAMLTAQSTRLPDGTRLRIGLGREDTDNEQFALNVVHWLSGLLR